MSGFAFHVSLAALLATIPSAGVFGQCEQELHASDGASASEFGASVAMEDDVLLVGAPGAGGSGAVYVFERSGGAWIETARLVASDASSGDEFGRAVRLDRATAVIGAPRDGPGSVYVFEHLPGGWVEAQKLSASDGAGGDLFGAAIDVDGDTLLVGAQGDDDHGLSSGSAYIYEYTGSSWVELVKLVASDSDILDEFGTSVSLSGDVALVGAEGDDETGLDAGAAYVFERTAGVWGEFQKLRVPGSALTSVGHCVAAHADTAMAGAPDGTGEVHVWRRMASNWSKIQVLTVPDALYPNEFGSSIALTATHALIGTQQGEGVTSDTGSAYLFERSSTTWLERTGIFATDGESGDELGTAVALSADTALLGARQDDDDGGDSGSAYAISLSCFTGGFAASFCPGDGTVNFCPCNNESAPGAGQGCANSSTQGGRITPSGSYGVAADDLVIQVALSMSGIALLEVGDLPLSSGHGTQSGDGLRCITTNIRRLGVRFPNASGVATWGPGLGVFGGWQPSESQFFQVRYRDLSSPCGGRFNFTNGLQVIFVP